MVEAPIPQANILEGGWRFLEPEGQEEIRKLQAADAEERELLATAYARLFSTPEGQRIMHDLLRLAWFHPGFDGTQPFERAAALGIERDGMKKILHYIQFQVARGKGDDA